MTNQRFAALCLAVWLSAGHAANPVNLNPGAVFADCADCPQMVVIPPGSFTMGHDGGVNDERYEGPPHQVEIDYSFALGLLEITNAQFREFVAETGYSAGTDCRMWTGKTVEAVAGKDWRDPGYGRPPPGRRSGRLRVLVRREILRCVVKREDRTALPVADGSRVGIRCSRRRRDGVELG